MADDDEGLPASALDKIEHLQPKSAFITGFTWLFVSPKQWVFVITAVFGGFGLIFLIKGLTSLSG